jgi:negative regulator of sigma-B (phosphoserine phosphatase)
MGAMTPSPTIAALPSVIEWGVGARTLLGEIESGDLHIIAPFADGALVAAIDGLGHGVEAAAASRAAAAELQDHAAEPVLRLVERCHATLRRTRGAVLSLASFDAQAAVMTWTGVGNVEGFLFRADPSAKLPRESILLRNGVVGYQLPLLRATVLPVAPGDTLVFATDGIRHGFADLSPCRRPPDEAAAEIVDRYAKATDDALVVVARYLGARS